MKLNRITKILIIFISVLLFNSCNNRLHKAFKDLERIKAADRSYVVQPVYKTDKESSEFVIKELFSAEEVRIGTVGMHKFNEKTNTQENEKYWLKTILLNSESVIDFDNRIKMDALGKDVANTVLKSILNKDKYNLIQITFIEQRKNAKGVQQRITQNIFYTIPNLEVTDLSTK